MGAAGAPVFGVPESTPASRPFSLTIRLKTSATERTPWAGFQSYLPDITRASPVNFSESVPASFPKVACIPAGCDCPRAQRHHQSNRKCAHSVPSQSLLHVELLLAMLLPTGQYAAKNQCLAGDFNPVTKVSESISSEVLLPTHQQAHMPSQPSPLHSHSIAAHSPYQECPRQNDDS